MSFIKLINLAPGERIVRVFRRYLLTYVFWWLASALLAAGAFFFLFRFMTGGPLGIVLFFGLLAFALSVLLTLYFIRARNACYLTTERLIDVEQVGIFGRTVSDIPYDQIEDVSGNIRGLFGAIFRYGQVVVQTSGGRVRVILDRVKHPLWIQQEINRFRENYLHRSARRRQAGTNDLLAAVDALSESEARRLEAALRRRLNE